MVEDKCYKLKATLLSKNKERRNDLYNDHDADLCLTLSFFINLCVISIVTDCLTSYIKSKTKYDCGDCMSNFPTFSDWGT